MGKATVQHIKFLAIGSVFFALSAALSVLAVNSYWLGAPVDPSLRASLPIDIWDGVTNALIGGIIGEAIFFGIFFYPAAKIGKPGLFAYLAVNAMAAAYGSMIYSSQQDPTAVPGWGFLPLLALIAAPIALTIILAVIAAFRVGRRAKAFLETQRLQTPASVR